jgi:transcriptional regulator with XRE-family HTH domain
VTDLDRAIGRRIRDRRIALGLTQQQIADLIGANYQQAHKHERGIDRISAGRLLTICAALGWTTAECLASIEQPAAARVSLGIHQRIELAAAFARLDRRHARASLNWCARSPASRRATDDRRDRGAAAGGAQTVWNQQPRHFDRDLRRDHQPCRPWPGPRRRDDRRGV